MQICSIEISDYPVVVVAVVIVAVVVVVVVVVARAAAAVVQMNPLSFKSYIYIYI